MRKNLLISLALMALPTFAVAQDFNDLAQFEVLSGWRNADGTHVAAVKITLKPGWITYWRAPGEAGIPPQFSFTSTSDIASITPHWPVPDVFDDAGLRSIGYYDGVVFPLTVDANGLSGDIPVSGELIIGVCDEICIPVTFAFDTVLPAAGQSHPAIKAALADNALTRQQANVGSVTCQIDPINDGLRMTTIIDIAQKNTSEFVVVEPSDPRHRHQRLRDMHRPHHGHSQRRVMDAHKDLIFKSGLVRPKPCRHRCPHFYVTGIGKAALPRIHINEIGHGAAGFAGGDQFLQHLRRDSDPDGFDHHPDFPATGQPHGKCLIIGNAIVQNPGAPIFQTLHRLHHHSALNAAAGHRSSDLSCAGNSQLAADRARGRTPGLHHRRNHRLFASLVPGKRNFRYVVKAMGHNRLSIHL